MDTLVMLDEQLEANNDAVDHAWMLFDSGEISIEQVDVVIADGRTASYAVMAWLADHAE